jgi:hypothetical protein
VALCLSAARSIQKRCASLAPPSRRKEQPMIIRRIRGAVWIEMRPHTSWLLAEQHDVRRAVGSRDYRSHGGTERVPTQVGTKGRST